MRALRAGLFLATLLATPALSASLAAQQFTVSRAPGVVIALPGGRLAILQAADGRVIVEGLVDGKDATGGPDLATGDRVTRFQGTPNPTLDVIRAGMEALAAGAEVILGVVRGDAAERLVRFAKQAPGPGPAMAVTGGGPGAGAWVSGAGPIDVQEVVIAGAHVRSNSQGMPEVTHRSSHPAASTVALRVGDVITAVNGRSLAALAGLELFLGQAKTGDPITLAVTRAGQAVVVSFVKPAP